MQLSARISILRWKVITVSEEAAYTNYKVLFLYLTYFFPHNISREDNKFKKFVKTEVLPLNERNLQYSIPYLSVALSKKYSYAQL